MSDPYVYVPPVLVDDLERVARDAGVSASDMIAGILLGWLESQDGPLGDDNLPVIAARDGSSLKLAVNYKPPTNNNT